MLNYEMSSVLLENVKMFLVPKYLPVPGKGYTTSFLGLPSYSSCGTSLRGTESTAVGDVGSNCYDIIEEQYKNDSEMYLQYY